MHDDAQKLARKIKANLNGKQIYENVLQMEGEISEYLAKYIAKSLNIPVITDKSRVLPFTLIVESFYKKETRQKYFYQDYAVLYKKPTDEAPTYFLDGTEPDPLPEEDTNSNTPLTITDEYGNEHLAISAYEAKALAILFEKLNDGQVKNLNTGDWYHDLPARIKKWLKDPNL